LPPKGFLVMARPMKIGKGRGAPLRIVAEIEP
jgi:kynurenine formamidase